MKKILLFAALVCLIVSASFAQSATHSSSNVPGGAFDDAPVIAAAHQQNSIARHGRFLYFAYYNRSRKLCLARNDNNGTGTWKVIVFDDTYNSRRNGRWDNHNTPNVSISPVDKSVHLAFDHHGGQLKYKISRPNTATVSNSNWKKNRFSSTRNYLKRGQRITSVTYPRFVVAKNNTLMMFWRQGGSGKGDSFLARYNASNQTWSSKIKFIDGFRGTFNGDRDRCAYFNDIVVRNGRIYATWMWRENGSGGSNHDLMFAYSDDNGNTWKNNRGGVVGASNSNSRTIHLNSSGIKVRNIPVNSGLINQNGMAVDGNGDVHVVLRRNNRYEHHYRVGRTWRNYTINAAGGGDRPKVYCDRRTNTLYLVVRQGNNLVLYASKANNKRWNRWSKIRTVGGEQFTSSGNSIISSDGRKLYTMAISKRTNELKRITFSLNSSRTREGDEIALDNSVEVKLFPNPSSDFVSVDMGNLQPSKYTLINASGSVVKGSLVKDVKFDIDVSELAKGLYLLNVEAGEENIVKRISVR